jgi:predicted nucleic acid-binding protein
MVTALDSSILLDVLTNDPKHGAASLRALRDAAGAGALVVCPVVWAELRAFFDEPERMRDALTGAAIAFDPFDRDCADMAGSMWREYRREGGTRVRLLADFLVGAHAQVRGGRLLTRDRGFFKRYFSGLTVLSPP